MNPIELSEEIAFELESMQITVDELVSLHQDMVHKEPTLRDILRTVTLCENN